MLELITLLSSYIQLQKPPPKKSLLKVQKPPSFADFLNGIDYLIEMIEATREEEGERRRKEEEKKLEGEWKEGGGRREILQEGFADIKVIYIIFIYVIVSKGQAKSGYWRV